MSILGKLFGLLGGGDNKMAVIDKVLLGEALVGDGNEVAHIDLMMGPRGSAASSFRGSHSKPLFGSQGVGVHLLDGSTGLVHDETFAGVYYLQSFIDCGDKDSFDIRVFVINGKAISSMTRRSTNWITNRAFETSFLPCPHTC